MTSDGYIDFLFYSAQIGTAVCFLFPDPSNPRTKHLTEDVHLEGHHAVNSAPH